MSPVVVKVGGSLLDWPGLPARLPMFLEAMRPGRPLLITGGGRFADAVRALDESHGLGEARSHRLALRSLDLTAAVLADLVPGLIVVRSLARAGAVWDVGRTPVLAPRRTIERDEARSPAPLPRTWDTTTDSIAARVAVLAGADRLILLKSAPLPPGVNCAGAARLGLVDPVLPTAAQAIPRVDYLDFRDPRADLVPLNPPCGPAGS